jgi:bacteriorhodopsin
MDSASVIMFVFVGVCGLIFTFGALTWLRREDDPACISTIFCSATATVAWWAFASLWVGAVEVAMYLSIAFLFYAVGFCTFALLLHGIVVLLQNSAKAEGPQLRITPVEEQIR